MRFVLAALVLGISVASAQKLKIGPAPNGEATVVAQKVIQANFPASMCPLVVQATRLGDGSIRATCNNGALFRVMSVEGVGVVAMNCAAAEKLGVPGC